MNVIKIMVSCFFSQEKLEIMLVNTQVPRDTKAMVAKVLTILMVTILCRHSFMRLS